MVCSACGYEQVAGARFCGRCGAAMGTGMPGPGGPPAWMPPGPPPSAYLAAPPSQRVGNNLQPLGVLWIVFGVYRIVALVVAAVAFHALARNGMFGDVPPFLHEMAGSLLPLLAVLVAALSLVTIFTGWALLTRRTWGRTLAIVMGVLALLKIPLGTALGIYTLWVLAPRASALEWDALTGQVSPGSVA